MRTARDVLTMVTYSTSSTPTRSEPLKTSNYLSSLSVRPGVAKSYLISVIRQLFTDHAAASTLKMSAPTGTQVAVANIHHASQCNSAADHTVYSMRLEVGHLTVLVDVKMSNRSRNSTSLEQCAFAFRGWHCCVVPILRHAIRPNHCHSNKYRGNSR
jgi:hypothetical protein